LGKMSSIGFESEVEPSWEIRRSIGKLELKIQNLGIGEGLLPPGKDEESYIPNERGNGFVNHKTTKGGDSKEGENS